MIPLLQQIHHKIHSIAPLSPPPIPEWIDFTDFHPGENYHLITPTLRDKCDSLKKTGQIYRFTTPLRKIAIYIILPVGCSATNKTKKRRPRNHPPHPHDRFTPIFIRASSVVRFFDEQLHHLGDTRNCSRELSIYLYLTKEKKTLPAKKTTDITAENVNTGFTFGCSQNNEIYVYREEEWAKVLTHECIHALGADFASIPALNALVNRRIWRFFGVPSSTPTPTPTQPKDLRIYEAYTETWATIIDILFTVPPSHTKKALETVILKEREWALTQTVKIMEWFGLNNGMTRISAEKQLMMKEKVTLYSYYVLKSRFLFSLPAFFEFCLKNKGAHPLPFQIMDFTKTEKTAERFADFITDEIYSPVVNDAFTGEMAKVQMMAKRGKGMFRKKTWRRSLRMTREK
jgi:hypothetical protein